MKRWTLPVVIGAVALAATAAAFGVSRASAATFMHRTTTNGASSAGCQSLMGDPAAMKAMQPLHAEHLKDMQAWQDKYGNAPTSTKAQTALKQMRKEHVSEMRTAFRKLGIKVPAGACNAGMMDGTNGTGMMRGSTSGTGIMGADAGSMMGGTGATSDVHQQHHGGTATTSGGVSGMMGGTTTGTTGGMMGGATY
jgi:hypothetical protein